MPSLYSNILPEGEKSSGKTKTSSDANNYLGRTFECLTVLGNAPNRGRIVQWRCRCACGKEHVVDAAKLKNGHTKSCGCHQIRIRFKHGHATRHAATSEYGTWESMIQRCNNPRSRAYKKYGANGITVCARWLKFEYFLEDMGLKPSPKHTLDRYPNRRGNYEPSNCRWATYAEQNRNKQTNKVYTFQGETLCITDWASRLKVHPAVLRYRLLHWPIERALFQECTESGV